MARKKITITLDKVVLADLDRRARWTKLIDAGRKLGQKMGVTSEDQVYTLINKKPSSGS